ncbi:MAG: hypothetical protein QXO15_05610 [Nitrososphaerota archaeon]
MDEILYTLMSSAYTLARESTPIALAIYGQRDVLAVTQPLNPEEALKKTFKANGLRNVFRRRGKGSRPPQVERLSRLIDVLKSLENAAGLLSLLQLEYAALLNAAKSPHKTRSTT